MKCPSCGYDVPDNEKKCQNCGQEFDTEVRPISRQEIENFEGITIDSDENGSEQARQSKTEYTSQGSYTDNTRPRVYVKQFNSGSLLGTLLIGALILAFVFFVLPTILLIGLAVIAVWYIFRMFV